MSNVAGSGSEFAFGPFRLDVLRRELREADRRVPVGVRAFAILCALLERPGELVSKAKLFEAAWPGVFVDDTNLKVQIAGLRRALGEEGTHIRAEAGLGYRYVGPVRMDLAQTQTATEADFKLPKPLESPIGRETATAAIQQLLARHRLVSVVGPGGIGKTTVALAVARSDLPTYPDGVCFVDFGLVSDAAQAPAAVAAAFGRPVSGHDPLGDVLLYLRGRELLLVLDCCEHITDMVAR